MKTKKITAVLMAAAMAVSMAATTAMTASAEELDTPVSGEELLSVTEVGHTLVPIEWNFDDIDSGSGGYHSPDCE